MKQRRNMASNRNKRTATEELRASQDEQEMNQHDGINKLEEDITALETKIQSFDQEFASKEALLEIRDKIMLDFSEQQEKIQKGLMDIEEKMESIAKNGLANQPTLSASNSQSPARKRNRNRSLS